MIFRLLCLLLLILLVPSRVESRDLHRSSATITQIEMPNGSTVNQWMASGPYWNFSRLKPHCYVTLVVREDESELNVTMHVSFFSVYAVGESVEVVRDQAGRWLPLFTKLKDLQ